MQKEATKSLKEGGELRAHPKIAKDSRSDLPHNGRVPLDDFSQSLKLCKGKHGQILHYRFGIKKESYMCASLDLDEPASYEEAMTLPKSVEWMVAMREKMSFMARNRVWELVDLLPWYKTIGNKWVLKIKCKSNGLIKKIQGSFSGKRINPKKWYR